MKIQFEQSVDVSGEVTVTTEDITSALDEALIDAIETESSDVPTERTKQFLVMRFVSDAYKCLAGTTDAMIARVAPSNRKTVATRLREQADRWDAPVSSNANADYLRQRFVDVVPGLTSKSWEDIWERVRDKFAESSG